MKFVKAMILLTFLCVGVGVCLSVCASNRTQK